MTEDTIITEEDDARAILDDIVSRNTRCQSSDDKKLIYKAFELAMDAHKQMRRKSGELYITHPLAVAKIVSEDIGLGPKSIASALLHDVIEDSSYTVDDLKNIFGDTIASIVSGLTKLDNIFDHTQSLQAENFRKLLLTMVDDIRVILIKLADRLHNMRTLSSMAEHKQYKIAGETLYIYAPLAHRLGLYTIKSELEDLSLKYEHPSAYQEISEKLMKYKNKNDSLLRKFGLQITSRLYLEGYDPEEFDISSRSKSAYSVWKKMQKKNIPFEEIYDLMAFRIIFTPRPGISEKTQCWHIYSIITDIYTPKPDRLRDWVSVPKPNGYEALHATVMGVSGRWFEVQIRSNRMNEIAERGLATHWKYKGSDSQSHSIELENLLKKVRELLENPDANSLELLDDFKLNLFSSEMMIFTPKGDMKILPKGVTVLDLAFEIHTDVGYKCIGAKVNYKLVPVSHVLKSGDQVEILTSEKQSPKYEWLNFVVTPKAKNKIKDTFKQERKDNIQTGENKLQEALNQKKLSINSKILNKLQTHYNIPIKEELYYRIGKNTIRLDNLQEILSEKTTNKWIRYWRLSFGQTENKSIVPLDKNSNKPTTMNLSDDDHTEYKVASCCNPIPGDDVVGYRNKDDKIILHRRNCHNAIRLMSSEGDKIVSANWESRKILSYLAILTITGFDQIGIVSKITNVISNETNVNMRSVQFETHDGIFEGTIYLYIYNTEDLNNIIEKITEIKGVHTVNRQHGKSE